MRLTALLPVRAFVCLTLGSLCLHVWAGGAYEQAKQRGKLLIGVRYAAPPYTAGAKFRTPEGLEQFIAAEIAARLHVPMAAVGIDAENSLKSQTGSKYDAALVVISAEDAASNSVTSVPTGHAFSAMVIMRSDTAIRTWEQLRGHTVCTAEGGFFAGMAAALYGARELVFKSPADSLLALRTGGCDAALHDSAMLEELIKLPEWKKFSAGLKSARRFSLVFAVRKQDSAARMCRIATDTEPE